jgi:hypothetical protein
MTTIAFKDGVLAGEELCTREGVRVGWRKKVRRIKGGRVAMTGYLPEALAIVGWLDSGREGPFPQGASEAGAVIWVPDEGPPKLIEAGYESDLPYAPPGANFHAWGTGAPFALGAMANGASAIEAVRIAKRFDTKSDGRVTGLGPPE